jgi:TRAP-type C4-dicarboxylate transport system substrate-binding protein
MLIKKLALAIISAGLLLPAGANAEMKLRAGSVLPPSSDQGQAAEIFAKRVFELTNGEITVKVFHSGELGPPPTQYKNIIAGAQDLIIDTLDYFKAYDDRFGVINTPFVFRSRAHFQAYLNSPSFADIAKAVEARGMVFLGNYNWMRQQDRGLLCRKPIMTPEDLQGVKMRMFQAEMPILSWSEMGANIQVLSWADVYTALATGSVDCLTTVISASYLNKHIEAVKYFTNIKEYFQIVLPVISKRTWDKLNDAQKKALNQAANEAGTEYIRLSKKANDEHTLKAQEELGLYVINPPLGPWRKRAESLHSTLEAKGFLPKGIVGEAKAIK